jgi:hypothetical protein
LWQQVETVFQRQGLRLLGGLPVAWTASEPVRETRLATAKKQQARAGGGEEGESKETDDDSTHSVALEIHTECVVCVLRQQGRVVSARTEGRMERPLSGAWLTRLFEDVRAEYSRARLEVVCLDDRDEDAIALLLPEIARHTGEMPLLRNSAATRQGIWQAMTCVRKTGAFALPVIRFGELPKPIWTRTGFWHAACPVLVLLVCAAVDIQLRMDIRHLRWQIAEAETAHEREAQAKKQEVTLIAQTRQLRGQLDEVRRDLARVVPEVERLQAIEGMASQLPELLRVMARSISEDVVLEQVRNSRAGGEIGDIQIVAWSSSYGSAQGFASRAQEALAADGYTVAQTDVKANKGRDGRAGYLVSFWLVPRAAVEELGLEESAATHAREHQP